MWNDHHHRYHHHYDSTIIFACCRRYCLLHQRHHYLSRPSPSPTTSHFAPHLLHHTRRRRWTRSITQAATSVTQLDKFGEQKRDVQCGYRTLPVPALAAQYPHRDFARLGTNTYIKHDLISAKRPSSSQKRRWCIHVEAHDGANEVNSRDDVATSISAEHVFCKE